MRRYRTLGLILAAEFLCAAMAFAEGGYKIEPLSGLPADAPKALQETLQAQGTRLLNDQGGTVCEVWLRKAIPTQQAAGGSADILYGNLAMGTLVGVLRFPNGGSDFRGQTIKAGIYTLRYALIPQDGNHMGVSPNRDFLLLSPVAQDAQIDKQLEYGDLLKLSRQASGTGHPAVLSLGPVQQGQSFPGLVHNDQGYWLLQFKLQGQSASGGPGQDFPVALTLVGKVEA